MARESAFKQLQHMRPQVGCPRSEQPVVGVLQHAAAAHHDDSAVRSAGHEEHHKKAFPPFVPCLRVGLMNLPDPTNQV